MRTGPMRLLEEQCRRRGYTLAEVEGCIIARDGERVTVDERHAAYPRVSRLPETPRPAMVCQACGGVEFMVVRCGVLKCTRPDCGVVFGQGCSD